MLRYGTAAGLPVYPGADGGLGAEVGSAAQHPEQLRHALWTAHQLLDAGSAKAAKRVWIFTSDVNPPGDGPAAAEYRCGRGH